MMLWRSCAEYASKFGKLSNGHRTGKGQFSFQSQWKLPEGQCQRTLKLLHSCTQNCTAQLNSKLYRTVLHACKIMLKVLQARLQQYVNCELPVFKVDLEKAGEPEIKLPTSTGSLKKQESSRKTSTFASLTLPKSLTLFDSTKAFDCVE